MKFKRFRVTWKDTGKRHILLSPIFYDVVTKIAARKWVTDRLDEDKLTEGTFAQYDVVEEEFPKTDSQTPGSPA